MASLYTENQKQALKNVSVYDYMYQKLNPPVAYGERFFVHINTKRGEVTGKSDPGAISIDPEQGYNNFSTKCHAKDGWGGVQVAYALMDYYNTMGRGYYDPRSTKDFAEIIAEISADMGITQDKNSKAPTFKQNQPPKPKNLLERYNDEVANAQNKEPVEVPEKAQYGANGYSPDATIIKYMAERGIDSKIVKDLIWTGLIYLNEAAPYYEMEKDAQGNLIKDENGKFQFKLDAQGNKIPQTYKDKETGEIRPKMQYNLVFASKDQSKENAFFERKPLGRRGQAFIAPNSSPVGYFSFTGGKEGFQQADIPEKTGKPMKAYICEAPIDAISLYAIHQKMGMTEPAEYIAISGVAKDLAVQRAIVEGYDCILAFDNDVHGRAHMDARRGQAFIDPYTNKEVSLPGIIPPTIEFDYNKFKNAPPVHVKTKDWNDLLLALTKGYNHSKDILQVLQSGTGPLAKSPKPLYDKYLEETAKSENIKINLKKDFSMPIEPRRPGEANKNWTPPPTKQPVKEKSLEKEEAMAH